MSMQEAELLKFAEQAATRRPEQEAFVVNLSGIPGVEDHGFFRILARRLREKVFGDGTLIFPLAQFRIVFVVDGERGDSARRELDRMGAFLRDNGRGTIEYDRFALANDSALFLRAVRRLHEFGNGTAEARARFDRGGANSLSDYGRLESVLRGADIESLIRSQTIHDLGGDGAPAPVARELVVSLDYLERLFATPIQGNPWLFERITDLLDRRMLYHLLREQEAPRQPLAIKLHVSTVLSDDFTHVVEQFAADRFETLLVLLPYLDVKADLTTARRALARLDAAGVHGGIDTSPWVVLDWDFVKEPAVDFVKVPYGPEFKALSATERGRLGKRVAEIGPKKIIMNRCVDAGAVETGRAMGIVLFEGAAADTAATEQLSAWRRGKRAAQIAEFRQAEARTKKAGEREDEEEASSGASSFFSKILKHK